MKRLKTAIPTIALFILIGIFVQWLSSFLDSDFVDIFLERDLVSILLALLAINITTISVILSKMQEMAGKGKLDYSSVIEEMQVSINEQVILLIFASILLIFKKSSIITNAWQDAKSIMQIGLISVLVYAIRILYSTGNGIFIIARVENKRMLEKQKGQNEKND